MPSQHYLFAHKYIPYLFLEDPDQFLAGMIHTENKYIHDVWNKIGEVSKEQDPDFKNLSSNGLDFSGGVVEGNHFIGVITMPPPTESPEAYFVALVLQDMPEETSDIITLNGEFKKPRVITLEKGMGFGESGDFTVLAEWEKELHKNYGNGPEPEWNAFVQSVTTLLSK